MLVLEIIYRKCVYIFPDKQQVLYSCLFTKRLQLTLCKKVFLVKDRKRDPCTAW